MNYSVLLTDTVSGKNKRYERSQIIKYKIGERTFVSMSRQFVELIYKGDKLNLYKLVEPVIPPIAAATLGAGAVIGAISASSWVQKDYYFFKKGTSKGIDKLGGKKELLTKVVNDDQHLVKEIEGQEWKALKNDSTLISIFMKYNWK